MAGRTAPGPGRSGDGFPARRLRSHPPGSWKGWRLESLIEELSPRLEPGDACLRFLDLPYCLLLESGVRSERFGRHSFLVADPFLVIRSKGRLVEQLRPEAGEVIRTEGDPFRVLQDVLTRHASVRIPGLPPFQGGAAGLFGYELGQHLEKLPSPRHDDLGLPDLCVGLYDWVLAWDHGRGALWLVSTGEPAPDGRRREQRAAARARDVRARLGRRLLTTPPPNRRLPAATGAAPETFPVSGVPGVASTFSRAAYLDAVERTREYIRAGDIYQANISQRLEHPFEEHPFALYTTMGRYNPAPFAAYFDLGAAAVVSASPERFVRLEAGQVETRPIKGTAPRGRSPGEDAAWKAMLRQSEKNRAENVMIVDLLRNDLSKVCRHHTVRVPELCVLETHAAVHHLVSTVVGRLEDGLGPVDLLRAAFPGGSITGAPKIRAMEIIAELEPTRRGAYTGAIGYIGFDGTMDTNLAIRTFVVHRGTAFFHVGAGIVIDSDPALEYSETLAKARGLLAAVQAHAPLA